MVLGTNIYQYLIRDDVLALYADALGYQNGKIVVTNQIDYLVIHTVSHSIGLEQVYYDAGS